MAAKYWRKRVVASKLETTYGTDPTPTGADAVLTKNTSFTPQEGGDKDLAHETPFMGADPTIPIDLHGILEFDVDLVGSGTAGTPPAFGTLLRACGLAETIVADTSVTYSRISSGFESVTNYIHVDDMLFAMPGSRGNAQFQLNASSEPIIRFQFKGLYVPPSDTAPPTPNYSAWQLPKEVSPRNTPVFTIGGTDLVMRSFSFDLGNTVNPRFNVNEEQILIEDCSEMIQMQVGSTSLSDFNPFAMAEAGTRTPIILQHEATAGRTITITAPTAQMMRPGQPTEAQKIMEWPLSAKPLSASGGDQFTLTFT
jgi:hypothetical protein